MEKTDAQIQLARVGFTPVTDTRYVNVSDDLRPGADLHIWTQLLISLLKTLDLNQQNLLTLGPGWFR
jgi:hypothetical protein